ncbi:hypothetical protein E0Z10_g7625 [Xylaria hypoxylon]|uniref:Uncharacterized protein n=1 Tax=Xylaria hypoxylon TaxID=37992 RepID=A0A4Z0YQ67_9PEZI|nr:hypothetical protein E0Z10_g7625 [Xylaria hypoxylon]
MTTFLEDPRLRQRWNQISQTTEAVTENAAAGIWSFGHTYVTPCLGSVASVFDSCTTLCLGDREDRARKARERQRARAAAEFRFDFYDDWDQEFGDQSGLLGGWRAEDWDRLVAGSGKRKGEAGEVQEQPRTRPRGMSYGTRGTRKRASGHEDPTIIPSTAPLGFLGRLPFKIGGTLRYKPSAANLQEHPGSMKHTGEGEHEPLLGADNHDESHLNDLPTQTRKRSGTAGSGDTSDSFRSRGDLFPSDGEGEEDAVPLDDEFTIALDHVDDRSSSRTKSSKGKRIASYKISRSESRTTIDSITPSLRHGRYSNSGPPSPALLPARSLEDLQREELRLELEEDEALEKKRQAAANLALHRGLSRENLRIESVIEVKSEIVQVEHVPTPNSAILDDVSNDNITEAGGRSTPRGPHSPVTSTSQDPQGEFIPARLPHFR